MIKPKNLFRKPKIAKAVFNFWPPFFGTGISIRHIADDWRTIIVQMKLRWYNKNYMGTHLGGSLYAMTDPFYMMMLIFCLGKEYLVWDKATQIEYVKPGKGTVTAKFQINDDILNKIKEEASAKEKYLADLPVDITDESGEIVARLIKTLYIRKK